MVDKFVEDSGMYEGIMVYSEFCFRYFGIESRIAVDEQSLNTRIIAAQGQRRQLLPKNLLPSPSSAQTQNNTQNVICITKFKVPRPHAHHPLFF